MSFKHITIILSILTFTTSFSMRAAQEEELSREERQQLDLIDAIDKGSTEKIQQLINTGADINAQDNEHGETALIWATENDRTNIVTLLLQAGADVNVQDKYGFTALMEATTADIVQLMLRAGADITLINNNGHTALDLAQQDRSRKPECDAIITLLQQALQERATRMHQALESLPPELQAIVIKLSRISAPIIAASLATKKAQASTQ